MTSTERQEFEALRKTAQEAQKRAEFAERELAEWKAGAQKERTATAEITEAFAVRDAALAVARDLASVVRCYEQGTAVPQAILSRIAANKVLR
mgnify:CR=1 FL=1